MTILGTLLARRRGRDAHSAWNRTNLQASGQLTVTSRHFPDGGSIPREHVGKRVGGKNLSPHLAWSPPPPGTAALLVVVGDLDVPTSKPAVHGLALIDPSRLQPRNELPAGALSAKHPAAGVRILRSTISRGYHGPEPIKGHGPHRYSFQLFALAGDPPAAVEARNLEQVRPRVLLSSFATPVAARGRLTGTYER